MTDRSIVLLRHAKAERPAATPDFERRLTTRGHADAAAAGAWLAYGGHLPELVICSPAKRTRQTWHEVALGMAAPPALDGAGSATGPAEPVPAATPVRGPTVRYEARVYAGDAEELLELVRSTDPEVATLLLIGHNPAVSELSNLLDPVHAAPDGLRTSGVVVHRVPGGWPEISQGQAPLDKWYTARG
jgi:phosphohistidine phosphatase